MAFLGNEFSSKFSSAEASDGFEPVPAGNYVLKCTGAQVKETRSGDGRYIKVEFTILAPSYQNRKVYANFNISNPSQQAEAIGLRQLKAFTEAAGMREPLNDDQQLVGLEVMGAVVIRPGDGRYGDSNEIKRYKPVEVNQIDISNGAFPFGNNIKTTYVTPGNGQQPQNATNFSAAFNNNNQQTAFKSW